MIVPEINKLASMIDLKRDHQNSAVLWTLMRFLEAKQCGVILGDEVGCGKTYEALAVLALLWHHYQKTKKPICRVLVLCKAGLLRKWHDELTTQPKLTSQGKLTNSDAVPSESSCAGTKIACSTTNQHGIQAYLNDKRFDEFNEKFLRSLKYVNNLNRSQKMWNRRGVKDFRRVKEEGTNKIQVPEGLYLVNQHLLHENTRKKSTLLKYLYSTNWDVIIVDEAHHYGKGRKCDSIFDHNFGKKASKNFVSEAHSITGI